MDAIDQSEDLSEYGMDPDLLHDEEFLQFSQK